MGILIIATNALKKKSLATRNASIVGLKNDLSFAKEVYTISTTAPGYEKIANKIIFSMTFILSGNTILVFYFIISQAVHLSNSEVFPTHGAEVDLYTVLVIKVIIIAIVSCAEMPFSDNFQFNSAI